MKLVVNCENGAKKFDAVTQLQLECAIRNILEKYGIKVKEVNVSGTE